MCRCVKTHRTKRTLSKPLTVGMAEREGEGRGTFVRCMFLSWFIFFF